MVGPTSSKPTLSRRLAAIAAIALVVIVVIATIVLALDSVGPLIAVLALDAVIVMAGWYALTRAGTTRMVAVAFGVAALAAVVAVVVSEEAGWSLVVRLVAAGDRRRARPVRVRRATSGRSRAARPRARRCRRRSTAC